MAELEDLARRAAGGDRQAFTDLVRHTTPTVYRLALRMVGAESEAADIVQDTYIRAWQSVARLRDPAAALGWVCRICRNLCTDHLRARKRRPAAFIGDGGDGAAFGASDRAGDALGHFLGQDSSPLDPATLAASSQASDAIWQLVQTLRDKYRIVLLLHVVEGMSNDEISVALGCPVGTVESRLHRARQELAGKLERAARRSQRAKGVKRVGEGVA